MSIVATARKASASSGLFRYQGYRPKKTPLYQLILKHDPVFNEAVNPQAARDAGVAVKTHQRQMLERLCRYISRPAISGGHSFDHGSR